MTQITQTVINTNATTIIKTKTIAGITGTLNAESVLVVVVPALPVLLVGDTV